MGKITKKGIFDNMALYCECRINKNALLQTPSDCFFGDFAHWEWFHQRPSPDLLTVYSIICLFVFYLCFSGNFVFMLYFTILHLGRGFWELQNQALSSYKV